jgi:hypothetical protein
MTWTKHTGEAKDYETKNPQAHSTNLGYDSFGAGLVIDHLPTGFKKHVTAQNPFRLSLSGDTRHLERRCMVSIERGK